MVTARPSWARVASLVKHYEAQAGNESISISLVGPSVSDRYGDLTNITPLDITTFRFPTLSDSDKLGTVAISCFNGATALAHHWDSNLRPDAVLVVADRTETLGVAATACLMQIPLIHLQGGESSGSIDNKVRDINSKMADLHLTTNENTSKRLQELGENPANIHIVGCPSIDLVVEVLKKPKELEKSSDLGGVGAEFKLGDKFGIILFHPDTLNNLENLIWLKSIANLVNDSGINWLWLWPNPDFGTSEISRFIRQVREQNKLKNVRFVVNLPPDVFLSVANLCSIVVGNSSFGIRECSFLGIPVINLGKRQHGREKSINVISLESVNESNDLKFHFSLCLGNGRFEKSTLYGTGNAGQLSAKILNTWIPALKKVF